MLGWLINLSFAASGVTAVVITDERTVSNDGPLIAFTDGDQFRVRHVRTEGGSDLQTVADGSSMRAVVYKNPE